MAILRELHCQQMQGHLFARPAPILPASKLELARLRALFVAPLIKVHA